MDRWPDSPIVGQHIRIRPQMMEVWWQMTAYHRKNRSTTMTAMLPMMAIVIATAAMAQPVTPQVMFNGQQLDGGEKLVVIENTLLLPMQTLFDALEAEATYLPQEQHKITATRGNDVLNMWLGSTMLVINDRPVGADVSPTMVGYTIYVPLKAVVEAFEGSVLYEADTATAYISATVPTSRSGRPSAGQTQVMRGVILQTYPGTPGSLLARDDATATTRLVTLSPRCQIVRSAEAGQNPQRARLTDLRPGDLVEIALSGDEASRIVATPSTPASTETGQGPQLQHMRVQIVGVAGRHLMLAGGNTILVADSASILDQNSQVIPLTALQPQDRLLVILDTANNFAVRIVREASAGQKQQDTTPPTFSSITPANDSVLSDSSPLIVGRFSDDQSGINIAATTMLLNGEDVTAQAVVTEDRIEYQAAYLPDGPHQLDFTITDKAGNTRRRQWGFTIQSPADRQILAVSHNADKPLVAGEILMVTMKVARPDGQAFWQIGDWKEGIVMQKVGTTNTYIGSYQVAPDDRITAPIAVSYRPPQGTWQKLTAEKEVTIGAGPAGEIEVTSPQPDEVAADKIVISGTATAGHQVLVKIRYNKQRFFDMSHDLPEQTITVGADGKWQTRPVDADQGLYGRADTYDIRAELLGKDTQEVIAVVELTLRSR